MLVDKENNLGQAHYNAGPALYETTLFYYLYQGEVNESSIIIDCYPEGPTGSNDRFRIYDMVSNTIYFISYTEVFNISIGLGLPSFTNVVGIGG